MDFLLLFIWNAVHAEAYSWRALLQNQINIFLSPFYAVLFNLFMETEASKAWSSMFA